MNASNRLPMLLGISCLILGILIFFQWNDLELLEQKVKGREDRISSLKILIAQHPELIVTKESSKPKGMMSGSAERSLTAMFSQMINDKNLDPNVVSLTPSFDNKKKLNKIRCQLKSLSLDKAIDLIQSLKNNDSSLKEMDIDLQIQKNQSWNLTGYWAKAER